MAFRGYLKQVGRNIKAARVRRGLRQVDVEEEIGLEYKHYQKIESGIVNVSLETLYRLAKLYRVGVDELTRKMS